jgi:SAM-dependent methyltransferase
MKNKEKWIPTHYQKDAHGRIPGTHMHKIIGHAYEKIITRHASGLLADIGCGVVPYYMMYKDLVTDNICIDWAAEGEISFLDFTADLNKDTIALETGSVDTVLCTDVLEHISSPNHLFSEMTRILKPGGKLILTVPFIYWIHSAPHDHHRYTRYKLQDFCQTNNLQTLSIDEYGGLPEIIYDLVWKGYYYNNFPLTRYFLFGWRVFGRFLYNRKFVKKITAKTKESFPLGYILVAQKPVLI